MIKFRRFQICVIALMCAYYADNAMPCCDDENRISSQEKPRLQAMVDALRITERQSKRRCFGSEDELLATKVNEPNCGVNSDFKIEPLPFIWPQCSTNRDDIARQRKEAEQHRRQEVGEFLFNFERQQKLRQGREFEKIRRINVFGHYMISRFGSSWANMPLAVEEKDRFVYACRALYGSCSEGSITSSLRRHALLATEQQTAELKKTKDEAASNGNNAVAAARQELQEKIGYAKHAAQKALDKMDDLVQLLKNGISEPNPSKSDEEAPKFVVLPSLVNIPRLADVAPDKIADIYAQLIYSGNITVDNKLLLDGAVNAVDLMLLGYIQPHSDEELPKRIEQAKELLRESQNFDEKLVLKALKERLNSWRQEQDELKNFEKTWKGDPRKYVQFCAGFAVAHSKIPGGEATEAIKRWKSEAEKNIAILQSEIDYIRCESSHDESEGETLSEDDAALADLYVSLVDPCTMRKKMLEISYRYEDSLAQRNAAFSSFEQLNKTAQESIRDIWAKTDEKNRKSILELLNQRLEYRERQRANMPAKLKRTPAEKLLVNAIKVLRAKRDEIQTQISEGVFSVESETQLSDDSTLKKITVVPTPELWVNITDPITMPSTLKRLYESTFPGEKYSSSENEQAAISELKGQMLSVLDMKGQVLPLLLNRYRARAEELKLLAEKKVDLQQGKQLLEALRALNQSIFDISPEAALLDPLMRLPQEECVKNKKHEPHK